MGKPQQSFNQPQEISQVLQNLQQSIYILYKHYQPYLYLYKSCVKVFFLIVLIYIFYKLGHITKKDQAFEKKENLKKLIRKRNQKKDQLPKRISKLKSYTKVVFFFMLTIFAAFTYGFFGGYDKMMIQFIVPIGIIGGGLVLLIVYFNIKSIIFSNQLKHVSKQQEEIATSLIEFSSTLGPKVVSILQQHLCKEIHKKYFSNRAPNQCRKSNCKQLKSLLKSRNDSIAALAEQGLNFQWCSICKNKRSFDQHLVFEVRGFEPVECQNENEEVKNKLKYLVNGLERMRKWLGQTSPCNCSKLYWNRITTQIIEYKKTQKQTQQSINQLKQKQLSS